MPAFGAPPYLVQWSAHMHSPTCKPDTQAHAMVLHATAPACKLTCKTWQYMQDPTACMAYTCKATCLYPAPKCRTHHPNGMAHQCMPWMSVTKQLRTWGVLGLPNMTWLTPFEGCMSRVVLLSYTFLYKGSLSTNHIHC